MSMREIKFRAFFEGKMVPVSILHFPKLYANSSEVLGNLGQPPIMQWTGMKDKRGVEIYESDEVRILYSDWPSKTDESISIEEHKKRISKYGRIVWDFNYASWCISIYSDKSSEYEHCWLYYGPHGEIEVIGNIHQKP